MEERKTVIDFIKAQQGNRFRVIDNTGDDKKIIGGAFPDIIFFAKEPPANNNVLFVLKVETSTSNLVDSSSEWKAFGSVSSVFYLVLPQSKLLEAKKLVAALGIKARFASYVMQGGNVKEVRYE